MRLFVSLTPPLEAVQPVADAVIELGGVPGVRWSPPHRWHVTVGFLGEVEASAVAALVGPLHEAAAAVAPPRLRLSGTGVFGDRVLWAGVTGDLAVLAGLAAAVAAVAHDAGVETVDGGDRSYRPHVTLARAAGRGGARELPRLAEQLSSVSGPAWRASEVQLVQSHTSDGRYEVLKRLPLATHSS